MTTTVQESGPCSQRAEIGMYPSSLADPSLPQRELEEASTDKCAKTHVGTVLTRDLDI